MWEAVDPVTAAVADPGWQMPNGVAEIGTWEVVAELGKGDSSSKLILQDDSNAVLYGGDGNPLWASKDHLVDCEACGECEACAKLTTSRCRN